ncbi:hypothetical protein [Dysgonomonas sp. 511]|uniref:hypothetical protein n=1 Tax=Dysgonomonas sp. 511 TaxID=2302930 RepID=UPI0013D74476|nr:hypothetical protein [Dysgonomonas sp. 511]NDV80045.1 hypothetical protein [Dysgonomonas sp. 511]
MEEYQDDDMSLQSMLDDIRKLYQVTGDSKMEKEMFPIGLLLASILQRNLESTRLFAELKEGISDSHTRQLVDDAIRNTDAINRAYMSVIERISNLMQKYTR